VLIVLELFVAVTAIAGGIALATASREGGSRRPGSQARHSRITDHDETAFGLRTVTAS
jgi:hypothetical protein